MAKGDSPKANKEREGKRKRLRKSMLPVMLGLTAALVGLAFVITQTIVGQRDARLSAMNDGDTQIALQAIMQTVLEAESSQRGFILTGDKRYLEPFNAAKQRLAPAIADLRKIAARARDETTTNQVTYISGLAEAKFTEMERTISLTRSGMGDQARIIIDSDVGRQQMEGIRNAVAGEAARKAEQRKASFERAEGFEERQIPLVLGLGVAIILLVFTGFRAERTRSMAAVEAEQALALQEANERIELLARELNHRVKNLFSVILSIISLSARQTGSTKEIVESIRTRVHALSLAHNTSQGSMGSSMVGIGPIIAQTMEPYSDESGTKVRVRGPQLEIPTRMVTPMGMIIHELATNAAKYGSLSVPTGTVDIRWRIEPGDGERQEVSIRWTEEGGPAVAADDAKEDGGFGSQMMTLAASQLGGTISRDWQPSGLVAMLRFPLLEE